MMGGRTSGAVPHRDSHREHHRTHRSSLVSSFPSRNAFRIVCRAVSLSPLGRCFARRSIRMYVVRTTDDFVVAAAAPDILGDDGACKGERTDLQ
jgi:hypothetical protein